MELGILIFLGAFWVAVWAWPKRSKRVPENVVQLIPKSNPPRAELRAAGQVIEFKRNETQSKGKQ
jgi:hypothetical protein